MHYEPLLQAGRLSFVNLSLFLLHPIPVPGVGQASSLTGFGLYEGFSSDLAMCLPAKGWIHSCLLNNVLIGSVIRSKRLILSVMISAFACVFVLINNAFPVTVLVFSGKTISAV